MRTEHDGVERVYPFAFEAVENAEAPYLIRILQIQADAVASAAGGMGEAAGGA